MTGATASASARADELMPRPQLLDTGGWYSTQRVCVKSLCLGTHHARLGMPSQQAAASSSPAPSPSKTGPAALPKAAVPSLRPSAARTLHAPRGPRPVVALRRGADPAAQEKAARGGRRRRAVRGVPPPLSRPCRRLARARARRAGSNAPDGSYAPYGPRSACREGPGGPPCCPRRRRSSPVRTRTLGTPGKKPDRKAVLRPLRARCGGATAHAQAR